MRGLKYQITDFVNMSGLPSHSVWGAWIEIPAGAIAAESAASRTPYGVRGLKCSALTGVFLPRPSHSVWGAWIEINFGVLYLDQI